MTRLRAEPAMLGLLSLLLLVTCFLAAALPRAINRGFDDGARYLVTHDTATATGGADLLIQGRTSHIHSVELSSENHIAAFNQVWRTMLPHDLALVTGPPTFDATTVAMGYHASAVLPTEVRMALEPGLQSKIRLALEPGLQSKIRYVAGSAPDDVPGAMNDPVEVAFPIGAAAALQLKVGQVTTLALDGGQSPQVKVSGFYQVTDPHDRIWSSEPDLMDVVRRESSNGGLTYLAAALLSPAGYEKLYTGNNLLITVNWRLPLIPARLTADRATRLGREISGYAVTVSSNAPPGASFQLETRLDSLLSDFVSQLAVTSAILSIALYGLGAVAIGVVLLSCGVLLDRMRGAFATQRARGASLLDVAAGVTIPLAVVAVPAAVVGSLAALLVPGSFTPQSVYDVAVVVVLAVVPPGVVAAWQHRKPLGSPRRQDLVGRRTGLRRTALEALAFLPAVAGVIALRQRGLTTDAATRGADPLLSAVPVLLAIAAGLVVLRLYPYPLRLLGRVTRRGRGAVPFLGVAQASRQRTAGPVPAMLLLLATALAAFSVALNTSLGQAQQKSSWQAVGADAVVNAGVLETAQVEKIKHLPGVQDAVLARKVGSAQLVGRNGSAVTVIAIDLNAYRRLVAGTPIAVPRTPEVGPGPVPALFSPTAQVSNGLSWGGNTVPVRYAGRVRSFPGEDPSSALVVIPFSALPALDDYGTTIFVRGRGVSAAALEQAATQPRQGVAVPLADTRQAELDRMTKSPTSSVLHGAFGIGAAILAGYGVLAVLLVLSAGGRARGRTISYLRTLGLSRRQTRRLMLVELSPVVLSTMAGGWILGLALPTLVGDALDLRPFTGGFPVTQRPLSLGAALLLAGGLAAVLVVAILIDAAVTARRGLGRELRVGDEQ